MKLTKILGLLTFFISLIACSQTTQNKVPSVIPGNWKTIDEINYTIQYPDSFDLNKSGQLGTSFILFSKLVSQQDVFKENINMIIQDLTGQNIGLDKYVELTEVQLKTMMTNGKILENKRVKSGDSEFHKMIYTGTQGQFNLKFEQYYWVIREKAYVLTLTCEANQFDKYKDVGEKMMNSFRVK